MSTSVTFDGIAVTNGILQSTPTTITKSPSRPPAQPGGQWTKWIVEVKAKTGKSVAKFKYKYTGVRY